jgi:uncharacterized protein (DUF2235 family)
MKRIVILCDGTWNKADQTHPTNVRQLSLILSKVPPGEVEQIILYFQGVGVPEKGGWLERINEKVSGGAMGWGLDDKIAVAYMHLARRYEPGDQVYVMGFSRGAYTARSLVGLIRNAGLPRDPTPDLVRECFRIYRDREEGTSPDAPKSLAFRLRHSLRVTTSDTERNWRQANGHPAGHPFEVTYLGVWDTVGALGIPSNWGLPARLLNRKYRFHDTDLSRMVASARHAVAIDERRRSFVPTLWENLGKLRTDRPGADYRQEWFAGDHGSVGGGGDITGLSDITCAWIANGARDQGLDTGPEMFAALHPSPFAPLRNRKAAPSLTEQALALTAAWRAGPDGSEEVSHPAIRRWRDHEPPTGWAGPRYRPKTLKGVENGLGAFPVATIEDYASPSVRIA